MANINSEEYQKSLYFNNYENAPDYDRKTPKLWRAILNPEWIEPPRKGFFSRPKNSRTFAQKYRYRWEWVGDGMPDKYGSWSVFEGETQGEKVGPMEWEMIPYKNRIFEGPRLPDGSIPDSSLIRDNESMIPILKKQRNNNMRKQLEKNRLLREQRNTELKANMAAKNAENKEIRRNKCIEEFPEFLSNTSFGGKRTRKSKKGKKSSKRNTRKY